MRKFLSIIIPRYKETEQEVFPLLSSINGQVGIDFDDIEVIFGNDGNGAGELDNTFLSIFKFPVRQVNLKENKGPGVARQTGLDAAKGEYVMFCDADDTLHNVGVLGAMMQEAEKTACDMLLSSWLEEIKNDNGQYIYITHGIENTWMHGKMIRRQFLVSNNIRFHDNLRVHEDSYFLCIAAACTERRNFMQNLTSYVWKYSPDSITRRNNGIYTYESIPTFIKACCMAHKEVEKRNPEQMEYKILQFILYNYFSYHMSNWQLPENDEFLKNAEETFKKEIKPFWHYWKNAPSDKIAKIYNEERAKSFNNGVEFETLKDWIQRMGIDN